MTFPRAVPALAVAILLAGCLPWPHRDLLAPAITGTIRRGSTPVAAARVLLDTGRQSDCASSSATAQTDGNGAFTVGPVTEMRWLVLLIGDPAARWSLCVETASGRRELLHQGGIGMPPGRLEVACDLEAHGPRRIEAFGTIEGVCSGRSGW